MALCFLQAYDIEDFMQKCDEAGTGLFVVASFMNHAAKPNIYREFIGHMLFIYADADMPAGTQSPRLLKLNYDLCALIHAFITSASILIN